jgi:hypothetical protein
MTDRLSLKNDRERYNPLLDITLKVFLSTAVTFFLSSLMSTIGGIADGFVIAHTMDTSDVGALSLTSPIWFLSAVIYSILSYGAQPRIIMELTKGSREKARKIFSMINDSSRYIGIRTVMKMASDVTYTSMLKLNNLVIQIKVPEKTDGISQEHCENETG